jgi:hypothetical protein
MYTDLSSRRCTQMHTDARRYTQMKYGIGHSDHRRFYYSSAKPEPWMTNGGAWTAIPQRYGGRVLYLPHWLPALLFALAPTYWLLGPRRRARRRRRLGLCLN